ncbi:MAG: cytochrome c peroxidase [Chthoniobacteraceae bacterium]
MNWSRNRWWLLWLVVITSQVANGVTLQLQMQHTFAGEPLRLDSLRYQNSAQETLSVTRLSYLLSGFALQKSDGTWLELPGQVAWMSEDQHRTAALLQKVPPGNYLTLRFDVGLDAKANATDPGKLAPGDPLNPELNGLHWSWQGNYIFLALEGLFRQGNAQPGGYVYHLAHEANRTRINLAAPLDLTHDAAVTVGFDLAALLNAPHPLSFTRDGVSTHSRAGDPVASTLAGNLPTAFRLLSVTSLLPQISQPSPLKPLYLPATYTPYAFKMSASFPIPDLPRDNPLIVERVSLGDKLFHDDALSRTHTVSCATCHQEDYAFAEPRPFSHGVENRVGRRNAMPLFNLAWKSEFFWDGRAPSLRIQTLMPVQDHREMDTTLGQMVKNVAAKPEYAALMTAAYGTPEVSVGRISLALEQYVLTLTSSDSKFDRAMRGQAQFTDEEKRGLQLFMTEYDPRTRQYGADCFHCHGGPLFTDHQFHNNGLDDVPLADLGRGAITQERSDAGKFSTPSLRNVELTAPYMHDGRFKTLEEVVEHYNSGLHRSATLDPNLAKHPTTGLQLSAADKRALVAFLKTLTDPKYLAAAKLAQSK